MLRALGSASCDITHETRGSICYGHWVLPLVISHTRQRVRFVTGIGFYVLCFHTRDSVYDLLRALGCVSRDIRRYRGYDLLRALGSALCDIAHETAGAIRYGHWVLRLVISHTTPGVRFN